MAQRLICVHILFTFMKKSISLSAAVVLSVFILTSFTPADKRPVRSAKKISVSKKAKKHAVKTKDDNPYYIIIDKSDYELKVYDEDGWYATYPIVFGSKDLGDKMKEGDRKTPDGKFKIILKKIHPKWGPELLLDYPNEVSLQKFNERKRKGLLPKNAKIGSGIAIHATRPGEEWTVDNFYNWTDGCISVKYTEMKDLFSYIPLDTPVTIQQ
jgi:murein L,D-transpeptidase YafK